jgi:hypothetical protein
MKDFMESVIRPMLYILLVIIYILLPIFILTWSIDLKIMDKESLYSTSGDIIILIIMCYYIIGIAYLPQIGKKLFNFP